MTVTTEAQTATNDRINLLSRLDETRKATNYDCWSARYSLRAPRLDQGGVRSSLLRQNVQTVLDFLYEMRVL